MKLKRLRIRNVGPHRDADMRFCDGLTGVVGANGSGKSTAFNCIYSAFTNDYRRFPEVKEKLVSDFSGPEEDAWFRLTVEHDGKEYQIHRGIRPSASWMKVSGEEEKLTTAAAIRLRLERDLSLTPQLLDHFLILRQQRLFDFLSNDAAERAKNFQYLCNTEIAERIWDAAGERYSKDQLQLPVAFVDNRGELVANFRHARKKHIAATKTFARLKRKLLSSDERSTLRATLEQAASHKVYSQRLKEIRKSLPLVEDHLTRANQELEHFRLQVTTIEAECAQLQPQSVQALVTLQQLESAKGRVATRRRLLAELDAAKAQPEPKSPKAPKNLAEKDELSRRLTLLIEKQHGHHEFLSATAKVAKGATVLCPTCKSPLKDLAAKRATYLAELAEAEKASEELSAVLNDIRAYEYEVARIASQRQLHEQRLLQAQAAVDATKAEEVENVDVESLQQILADFSEREAQLKLARKRLTQSESGVDRLTAQKSLLRDELKRTKRELSELEVSPEAAKAARKRLHEDGELRDLAREQAAAIRESRREMTRCRRAVADLEELRKKTQLNRDWLEFLTRVRDVFHRNNAPRVVSQSKMKLLETDINLNLRAFNSPFLVSVGDNLELLAQMPGRRQRTADALSVGQKAILAFAYWFAVHATFGMSVLILDEPADGLDVDNLEYLRAALPAFQQRCRTSGLQVVMSSHAEPMFSAFDYQIQL